MVQTGRFVALRSPPGPFGSSAVNLMTTFVTDGSQAGPKELARPNPTQQIPRKNRMARRIAAAMAALAILAGGCASRRECRTAA